MSTEVTPGWLPWHPEPSTPAFVPPAGSVDAHCHVFGPAARFPFAAERKYTPVDAGKEQLFALRDHLGLSRNVIVQATCHGTDNSALVDALRASGGRARGVSAVDGDVTRAELERLHAAGVRGVRFNFVKRLVDTAPTRTLRAIAEKIAPLGWHVVLYFEARDLPDIEEFAPSLPVPIVIDHLGRPDVAQDPDGPEFSRFLEFADRHRAWVKVSCPERLSRTGPPALDGERHAYADVVPFARRAVEAFPDRVLWGTDWPHPNLTDHMPDDGLLLDHVPRIAVTPQQRQALLVDNPMRLYWPDEQA
ncbi:MULTISPECIES: amidohydrolase family protein [unclassified Saccharopolyspora]|uniref:amidohydrolase family protein n=1 Tax=unclassified Saccharopolyspora TaxID=2646250 RepID=UPI001CD63353|nr:MULTISPECIES: amidohydrolase family protein [unclassified Saccharopolyspora]MCA1187558.1 amidohydrolase family protein [Saccharopolyspora sp. 6T]MCA1191975.1 amidohydrolase family protein [Saccharopolyspora sp. 6V]MCA1224897.1 amidohydrolase family protein [Saccharopolyspora sp. 6M]MCA1279758.1 amidohydrolase family protein [Saccharopolyspora sp. 7B]